MKNFFLFITLLPLLACNNLDIEPKNGLTKSVAFSTLNGYQSYLAKIYASLTLTGQEGPHGQPDITIIDDEGFSSYLRVWWKAQELTTDEVVIAWTDAGVQDLNTLSFGSNNQFIRVLYYRLFYTISLVNDFLNIADNYPDSFAPEEVTELNYYKAEARFIRAFTYWLALDMFRNIPLLTHITTALPDQVESKEIFNFIESELIDLESMLLKANKDRDKYGRVNQGAAWMLLARLYLNAEVYIQENKYLECIEVSNKVINSEIYSLASNYRELFMGDNHLRPDEIIWPIVHDGQVSQTWGGTTFIIHGSLGGDVMNAEDYGVFNKWNGWRVTSALVKKFPNAGDTDSNGTSADGRAVFFTNGQNLEINDLEDFEDGYAAPKFTNIEASTGLRAAGIDIVSTDFPVFRLADAYLMLAESQLRVNNSVDETALGYLNQLRKRAYSNELGNIAAEDVTLDWILDERARELYVEAIRRTDLVRFDKFTGNQYVWAWKGGVKEGMTVSDHLNIFPIPSSELIANPKIKQNPNY